MELQEYIQLELRYNSNINEGLLGGNGIFGIFSAFFHKAGDKKNDDPIAEAMKTAQEQRQAAIEDKIKSTQDELKRALAEKIKAHSQEEINRITLEKNKRVEALKSVQARYKREQTFWKNNKQALTMDQRMSMLKKTDDMLDGIRKSASPEEMDNASRLAAIMHKYALKPDGTPWKDDEEFQKALDADGGKIRKEIEEAHKAAGRTFKIDNTKLSDLFRDVYDETASAVQTEGEAETLADQRADFDDKKQDAIAYLDAKEARKKAEDDLSKAKEDAALMKKPFDERFKQFLNDNVKKSEDGENPEVDKDALNAKWKELYGVNLPKEIMEGDRLAVNIESLKKGVTTAKDILSGDNVSADELESFQKQVEEDGEQTKAANTAYNKKIGAAQAKLDKTPDPDDATDSRINRGKELVNDKDHPEWTTKEAINAADEVLKTKENEVKDIQNKREAAIKAAQEQQKIATDQLKSDKEAKDDPKLTEKIKDLTAGCETGDTIGKDEHGNIVPGYYDENGKFIPKPEIEPGDEEGLKKYIQERDAVLMKTNGNAKGQDVVKDWSKNDDGTYSVTYTDKDGKEQTKKDMSMEDLAVMRAQHNSRAETQAYVDKVKSTTRDELGKIELDKDGKPKLTDEEKKKLSSTTQDVLKKLEDANGDSKKIEEILKDIEGDAAGDKKLKALGDAFKKSESSSEDKNNTDGNNEKDKNNTDDEDDAIDGDERTDNDDDLEDESENDEDKKKQDPHKIWKQRTYKRGKKTFKTKSFYNKKGDTITRKEFNEKVKSWKSTKESLTLHDYVKMIFG